MILEVRSRLLVICAWMAFASAKLFATPPVTAIAFSPDGTQLLAASQVGIRIYSWPEHQLIQSLDVSSAHPHDIEFANQVNLFAIGGGAPAEQGFIEILTWPQLDSSRVISAQFQDSVYSVAWSADGRHLAAASLDGQVAMIDPATGDTVRQFHGHSKGVTAVSFLASESQLVTGSLDHSLRVWDADTGELMRTLNNHTGSIHDIQSKPQSAGLAVMASAAADRTVRFWQPTIGRLMRFAKLHDAPVCLQWHPQRDVVVASTTSGAVYLIDAQTAQATLLSDEPQGWSHALAISPDGAWVVRSVGDQLIKLPFP